MIDYHLHSERSGDASGSIIDACSRALEVGLTELCFTEHLDFEPTDECYGAFDYDLYATQIDRAQQEFAGKLTIRMGVEVDFQSKHRDRIEEYLSRAEFDYVLGSAHYVGGIILEDHSRYFPGKTPREAYEPYFENALEVVETGWFDCIAHLDLCKRHGVRYLGDFDCSAHWEWIDRVLAGVVASDMALEINSSGLRQSPSDTYPCEEILRRYRALGGRTITVGSDSHRPGDVGAGVAQALDLARSVGFDSLSTFCRRVRSQVPIAAAH